LRQLQLAIAVKTPANAIIPAHQGKAIRDALRTGVGAGSKVVSMLSESAGYSLKICGHPEMEKRNGPASWSDAY
jgi:hypothetical protein